MATRAHLLLIVPLLASLAASQTPPDFPVHSDDPLTVRLNPSNQTITPGLLVPQAAVASQPSISFPSSSSASNINENAGYIALMLDPTVPVLHWLAANLDGAPLTSTNATTSSSPNYIPGVSYIPPQPPAGDGPHDYVILFYAQPADWEFPPAYSNVNPPSGEQDVVGFDFEGFLKASGLREVVGSNWFRVQNRTVVATGAGTASATAIATASAGVEMQTENGGAALVRGRWAGLVGMAVAALML